MTGRTTTIDTRTRLLAVAFEEIHRSGYQAASINNILAAASLTKGALYHYFPDKRALGLAVVEEVIRPRLAAMMLEPLAATSAPLATLQNLLRTRLAEENPLVVTLGCPLNNLMQEMSPVDETFRLRLNALFEDWVRTLAEALVRGQAAGEVDAALDAQETAFFIIAALEGCIGMSKNTQSVAVYRACLQQLLRYLTTLRNPLSSFE